MADEDVKLGTAADDEAKPVEAPDMNRYYYPPGTTEPVLRPEFAQAAAAPIPEDKEEGKAEGDADGPPKRKRGPLPDGFGFKIAKH